MLILPIGLFVIRIQTLAKEGYMGHNNRHYTDAPFIM